MKEELLNIAMQSLSDDDVKEIVKDKFKKMIERAVEDAFKWGDAEKQLKERLQRLWFRILKNMTSPNIFLS